MRSLSNSTSSALTRSITAYRKLDLSGPRRERARRAVPKRAKRLNSTQLSHLIAQYEAGASTYELAKEFGVHRTTISHHLKEAGVDLRLYPPREELIDEMIRLYASGLSLATVGRQLAFHASTVQRYLRQRGVDRRDAHSRPKLNAAN